jgi:putative ABC transport system substrate-binding protein
VDRRAFIGTLAGGLLAAPLAVGGQQAGRVRRVGILLPGSPSDMTWQRDPDSLPKKLAELGWNDGRNLVFEPRWATDLEDYPRAAAELVRLGVDVIVTLGPEATAAAMRATSTIPIVMSAFSDPGDVGAAGLAHPGGNVTGLTIGPGEVVGEKRLELLKEALPGLSRVAILWDVGMEQPSRSPGLLTAALALKLHLQFLTVTSVRDFDGAFRAAKQGGAEALVLPEVPGPS